MRLTYSFCRARKIAERYGGTVALIPPRQLQIEREQQLAAFCFIWIANCLYGKASTSISFSGSGACCANFRNCWATRLDGARFRDQDGLRHSRAVRADQFRRFVFPQPRIDSETRALGARSRAVASLLVPVLGVPAQIDEPERRALGGAASLPCAQGTDGQSSDSGAAIGDASHGGRLPPSPCGGRLPGPPPGIGVSNQPPPLPPQIGSAGGEQGGRPEPRENVAGPKVTRRMGKGVRAAARKVPVEAIGDVD